MAVKMRLRRVGAKKQPAYRIVIADARTKRDGRAIEVIGHYNPLTDPATIVIEAERALYWLRTGAQPTDVVQRMLVRHGIWAAFTEGAELPSATTTEGPVVMKAMVEPVMPVAAPAPAPQAAPAATAEEGQAVVTADETPAPAPVAPEAVEEAPATEEPAAAEETPATDQPAGE